MLLLLCVNDLLLVLLPLPLVLVLRLVLLLLLRCCCSSSYNLSRTSFISSSILCTCALRCLSRCPDECG